MRRRITHTPRRPGRLARTTRPIYVFGFPRGDKQFAIYRNPKHYLVALQWTGAGFERIPFLSVPPQIRDTENVFPCVPPRKDRPLTLAIKEERWCPIRGDRWKFDRHINLSDYEALAWYYADLKNARPSSD